MTEGHRLQRTVADYRHGILAYREMAEQLRPLLTEPGARKHVDFQKEVGQLLERNVDVGKTYAEKLRHSVVPNSSRGLRLGDSRCLTS